MTFAWRRIAVAAAVALGIGLTGGSAAAQGDWQAGGGQKWQDLLAAARQEGKVVVAGQPPLADPFRTAFKHDTGIDLDFLGGNTRDLSSRFDNEARAGRLTIDVILAGGSQFPLIKEGLLVPLRPLIVLPGSGDGPWYPDGKAKFMDKADTYMFQGTNFLISPPIVNTDMVKPGSLTKYAELLKPEYKGKIAVYDPRLGGPGLAVASYLEHVFGIDFVKKLYVGQETKYTRNGRQLVEWVVRGVYPVALGASQVEIEMFRHQGIKNLAVLAMADAPGSLAGGFSVAKIGKGAPHPKAAAVFINWYMSQRGQQVYTYAMDEPSRRTDVDNSRVPDYIMPKPGVKYLDQYEEGWYLSERTQVRKDITKALGGH